MINNQAADKGHAGKGTSENSIGRAAKPRDGFVFRPRDSILSSQMSDFKLCPSSSAMWVPTVCMWRGARLNAPTSPLCITRNPPSIQARGTEHQGISYVPMLGRGTAESQGDSGFSFCKKFCANFHNSCASCSGGCPGVPPSPLVIGQSSSESF